MLQQKVTRANTQAENTRIRASGVSSKVGATHQRSCSGFPLPLCQSGDRPLEELV